MPTPGPVELIIILVIALIILGPGRLPDVGSALGKSIREFRKASSDIQDSVKVDVSTSPLPPAQAQAAPAAPPAQAAAEPPVSAPVQQPAVAATASDLPGAPTVASQPDGVPTNEPRTGTN